MKILIGTPSYDGRLHAFYVDSLIHTINESIKLGIEINHLFICFDALVQRARNDIFKIAYSNNIDYLFFIDSDIVWTVTDFLRLINHKKDIIVGTYRLKTDVRETYSFKEKKDSKREGDLIEIDSAGAGFMCISKEAVNKIYESSPEYTNSNEQNKMVFSVGILDRELTGEDIMFCKNWNKLGGTVYLDTKVTVSHIGEKVYSGDVSKVFEEKKEDGK